MGSTNAHQLGIGLGMAIALFCIGAGAIHWAKTLMPDEEVVVQRHEFRSEDEDRSDFVKTVKEGAENAGLGRRPLIKRTLGAALGLSGLTPLLLLRDLGPLPGDELLNYERDGSVAEGGELFRTNCAMCHNFAGQGGALTQGKYAPTVMGVEPKHIYEAMITGPQAMPVFSDKTLTPEEKLSIIKWIKSAESEPQLGGVALGRVGPVTEGLLAWTLGIGLLIGVAVWLAAKAR